MMICKKMMKKMRANKKNSLKLILNFLQKLLLATKKSIISMGKLSVLMAIKI